MAEKRALNHNHLLIDYIALSVLKQHPSNPFRADKRQVRLALKAAREFGFNAPLLVDECNQVLSSPFRLQTAQALGLEQVPVIRINHLSETQIRAFQIAEGRLEQMGEVDQDALRSEVLVILEEMPDLDVETLAFDQGEIDVLIEAPEILGDKDPIPESFDEEALLAQSYDAQPGDVWRLGEHCLVVGSCLDDQSWAKLSWGLAQNLEAKLAEANQAAETPFPDFSNKSWQGAKARLILTDPPYNVRIKGHVTSKRDGGHEEFAMASGEMSDEEFGGFLIKSLKLSLKPLEDGGIVMSFMDWKHFGQLDEAAREIGLRPLNLAVWNKDQAGMGSLWRSKHELIGIYKHRTAPHTNNVQLGVHGRYRTNVWDYPAVRRLGAREADGEQNQDQLPTLHPTVKPTELLRDAILDVTNFGDLVIDPFGGSGSLVLAAERARRRAGLIEIEPKYAEVTLERFEAFTGQAPLRVFSCQSSASREGLDQTGPTLSNPLSSTHIPGSSQVEQVDCTHD